jgi:hypothetical protein
MKSGFLIGVLILGDIAVYGQYGKLFDITETIQDSLSMRLPSSFRSRDSSIYEDEKYLVKRSCRGEYGGTIWFKKKATGITYSCKSTCPVCVNNLNGKYYVINTLAHSKGNSQILEIDAPDSMDVFKMPKPRKVKGKVFFPYVGAGESKSSKGAIILVDSIGVLTMASFPYQGELYYIISDFERTFIAKIIRDHFVTLDTLANVSIWTYDPIVTRTVDDHYVVFFENDVTKGYVDVFGNKISLYRYRKN